MALMPNLLISQHVILYFCGRLLSKNVKLSRNTFRILLIFRKRANYLVEILFKNLCLLPRTFTSLELLVVL